MRQDAVGMFWEDEPRVRTKSRVTVSKSLPPIPETGWQCPEYLPDLSGAKIICLDTETYDPDIQNGPGFVKGNGAHVVGIAVGTDDGYRGYFPIRHMLGGNLNPEAVIRWAKEQFGREHQPKVGHNLAYDLEALAAEGVEVRGRLIDTMLAEPLLDEQKRSYSLDATAKTHLGESKVDEALYKWSAKAYGGEPGRKQAGNIYRCPVQLVGPYAEADVDLPLRIYEKQSLELRNQHLTELYELECGLLPMLLRMRQSGVRVDVQKASNLRDTLLARIHQDQLKIKSLVGFNVEVWAAESIARAFDKLGVPYPRTAKTQAPSFTNQFFATCKHPLAQMVQNLRKSEKFLGTFINGYILDRHVNGRIYGQFHSLRSDEGGTVSGRFSSSRPNLQNIPSRDEELGPLVRSLFIPEDGCDWVKDDYSQVEYRILAHYGAGESADAVRALYCNQPDVDFHQMVADLCGISRKPAKSINFGLVYGMGKAALAANLGRTIAEAEPLFAQYHEKMPFVKELSADVISAASNRGWIKTLLGRRARFTLYESADWDQSKQAVPLPYDKAVEKYGRVRRAKTHKALNALIQGSAADVLKKAMYDIWKSGACDYITPHLTVHDELDWSVPKTKRGKEAHDEVLNIMQTCVKLRVPLICDTESGPSWGEVK